VTRHKNNCCYEVIYSRTTSSRLLADQIIRLSSSHGQVCYPNLLRLVHDRDPETGPKYSFLTNCLDCLSAPGLAQLQERGGLGTSGTPRLSKTMLLERYAPWVLLCPPAPDNRQPFQIQLSCWIAVIYTILHLFQRHNPGHYKILFLKSMLTKLNPL
jgi:hypothetical protein